MDTCSLGDIRLFRFSLITATEELSCTASFITCVSGTVDDAFALIGSCSKTPALLSWNALA